MKGHHPLALGLLVVLLVALMGAYAPLAAQGPHSPLAPPQAEGPALSADLGTSFTYQGRLTDGGVPANALYDFEFRLYDDPAAGVQLGGRIIQEDVSVANGLFTVGLDFGANAFSGGARYLGIAVRPGASVGGYTALSPRQALTAAPYALSLRPGAVINGTAPDALIGVSNALSGRGLVGWATAPSGLTYGVYGQSDSAFGCGVAGYNVASSPGGTALGVYGESWSPDGHGVYGQATSASGFTYGVFGESASTSGRGVFGWATAASGNTEGVHGQSHSTDGRGVVGLAWASSGQTEGVRGESASTDGRGVVGWATAFSGTTRGVYGRTDSPNGHAVHGFTTNPSGYAGYFEGKVRVTGNLTKGGGAFKIDHPLDPANQYLQHSFVESPDMKNVYDGNVTTDDQGFATVVLPNYFEALNRDYRYQLTVIGQFAQAIIAQEIADNRFVIQTDKPKVKVSWQVTGIRQDAYAQAHRIVVEEQKPEGERGKYLYPKEHGQPEALGVDDAK